MWEASSPTVRVGFEAFLAYVLPYRGSEEPVEDWLGPLSARLATPPEDVAKDGSAKALDLIPFEILDGASTEAAAVLDARTGSNTHLEGVAQLIEGFESTYGLELLATVHWASLRDDDGNRRAEPLTLDAAEQVVGSWNRRKERLFTPQHIAKAYERLQQQGWLDPIEPAGLFADA